MSCLLYFLDPFWTFYLGQYNLIISSLIDGALIPVLTSDSHLQATPATCALVMAIQGIFYFGIAVALDSRFSNSFRGMDKKMPTQQIPMMNVNQDVMNHEQEINADANNEFQMKAIGLHKTYKGGNPAVQGNTFGVKRGQILGLLGPNGAGKSTTFGIMALDHKRSFGQAYLKGESIDTIDLSRDGRRMGMCP